jgi:NAD(P)H-dependent FMN reductase
MSAEDTAHDEPLNLTAIIASTRENRFAPVIADWMLTQVRKRNDYVLDVIDLLDTSLQPTLPSAPSVEVLAFRQRIAAADAFLVITPEYNHSFPGPLKIAIDSAYEEWAAKPAALVSYGGVSGGLRAVEHLRQVFAELNVFAIRDTVSFHHAQDQFDAEGRPKDESTKGRAASKLLDQLAWWGHALRHARRAPAHAA